MEETIKNISLDELAEIEGFSIRTKNLCEYNSLKDLNSILNYYLKNSNFLRLRNCGPKSNLELIKACKVYNSSINRTTNIAIPEIDDSPEIQIDQLLGDTKTLTSRKRNAINNLIKAKFNELSVRSANALRNYLNDDVSLSNVKLILLSQESTLRSIHNVGEKSTSEIKKFINSIHKLIYIIITSDNEEKTSIELFNAILFRQLELGPKLIFEIYDNYDFTKGLPIFRMINVLIESGKLFKQKNKYVFKMRFNYYNDFKYYSCDEIATKLELTRERIRQIQLSIFENLDNSFSFLRGIEYSTLNFYGVDLTGDFIEIEKELVDEINKNENTNFNPLFITKILAIVLYERFMLIGNKDAIPFNKKSPTLYNWDCNYLISSTYVKIFDFVGFVENVSFRMGQRIEEDYSFHFHTYLLEFQKEDCISLIENIAQIAEYILFKEFELTIDEDENIVFKRNVKKQVIDYVYEILQERHEPLTIFEIFEIIEKNHPGITKSAESLRSRCQGYSNLIFFGRNSTCGLKKWEDELGIKSGKIRDIVEEYLQSQSEPKHIDEITDYLNNYRNSNSRSIYTNLKMDERKRFKFFAGSLIGLQQKEYLNEKYIYVEDIEIERKAWDERFKNLNEFADENSRLPNSSGSDDEVKLYRFMNIYLNKAHKGELENERVLMILGLASKFKHEKGKRQTTQQWDESYSEIIKFVRINRRLPKARIEAEKKMYWFFYRQQKLYFEQNLPLNFIDKFLEIANLLKDKI
jgi:predicted Zn-ribbon and HTH transcriptional regulator